MSEQTENRPRRQHASADVAPELYDPEGSQ